MWLERLVVAWPFTENNTASGILDAIQLGSQNFSPLHPFNDISLMPNEVNQAIFPP